MKYRDKIKGQPIPPHIHGRASTYQNWGCRCRPCTDAATTTYRKYAKAAYERRKKRLGVSDSGTIEHRERISRGVRKLEPRYAAMHSRARAVLPRICLFCGSTVQLECALSKDAPEANIRVMPDDAPLYAGYRYSVDENDYIRLCYNCHSTYDNRKRGLRSK